MGMEHQTAAGHRDGLSVIESMMADRIDRLTELLKRVDKAYRGYGLIAGPRTDLGFPNFDWGRPYGAGHLINDINDALKENTYGGPFIISTITTIIV